MFNMKPQAKKLGALAAYPRNSPFVMAPTKAREWLQKSSISQKKKATPGVAVNNRKTHHFATEVIAR